MVDGKGQSMSYAWNGPQDGSLQPVKDAKGQTIGQESLKQDKDGFIVERKQIVIGERLAGAVEVLSGLAVGDKVVTHGLQKIRGGQQVKVLSEEKPVAEHLGEPMHLSDLLPKKQQ